MKDKENIPQEIQGLSRKLPFKVPDNYFVEFPSRIQGNLSVSPKIPVYRFYQLVRPRLALAAMIIVLIAVGYAGLKMVLNDQDARGWTGNELSSAIEYFGYEFDDDMLIAAILESDIDLGPLYSDNESEAIIEYLSTEEIDLSEYLNEF